MVPDPEHPKLIAHASSGRCSTPFGYPIHKRNAGGNGIVKQIFIELFNYKDSWRALPFDQRQAFADGVLTAVGKQREDGVEVISWGFNDANTDRRAPYDFYCVYMTPSAEYQRGFEMEIAAAGWYEYFNQVNASGAVAAPKTLLRALVRLDTAVAAEAAS